MLRVCLLKAAEKAFFDIYKKFCDIADPVPTLEYCRESMKVGLCTGVHVGIGLCTGVHVGRIMYRSPCR